MNNTPHRWIALLETSGNQNYLFATNKLKENVGGSELAYRAGTRYVLEAVRECGGPSLLPDPTTMASRDQRKLIASQESGMLAWRPMEVIVATSGKAILLADSKARIQKAIQLATLKALRNAPGLEFWGASVEIESWTASGVHQALFRAHQEYEDVRSRLPGPEARFPRLPLVEPCAVSGWPASSLRSLEPDKPLAPLALPSLRKREAADLGWKRMLALSDRRLCASLNEIEKRFAEMEWAAIVHADGNGLGQIFLNFDQWQDYASAEQYFQDYRRFSLALEECSERAFADAVEAAAPGDEGHVPLAPLVVGGDDLTVLCDGRLAFPFTIAYLKAFEKHTGALDGPEGGIVPLIARKALGTSGCLSACAGVTIMKPHYPFYAGHQIAIDLIDSAKSAIKTHLAPANGGSSSYSALDFHVLYDSGGASLKPIRDKLVIQDEKSKATLINRPYVVESEGSAEAASALAPNAQKWLAAHSWSALEKRVEAANRPSDEDDRPKLPNSLLHELRESIFQGQAASDHLLSLVYGRYRQDGLEELVEINEQGNPSVFGNDGHECRTWLLDVIDSAKFMPREVE